MRADPAQVAQRLIPEEPRIGGIVLLHVREERRVGGAARQITVSEYCRTRADARVELCRFFVSRRDRHRKIERGLDCAAGGGGHVPGVEADVRS